MTVILLIIGYLFYIYSTLPDLKKIENFRPLQVTTVYDYKGRILTQFYKQKRKYVPIDKIPDYVKNAFIAVEDKSFYSNIGIDFGAIFRAFITDIKAGRIVEGGSTISQQLVKNLLLTPERKIDRKIKEILLAIELNRVYPKDKILEMYLNTIYLGHGTYGVQMASQVYFGKNVWDLSVCEAAVLAGLPKAPSVYDPYKNLEEATLRRDVVIQRMLEEGYIDEKTAIECKSEPIILAGDKKEQNLKDYSSVAIRNWFVSKFGYKALYEGGYKIYTTIDKDLQMNASEIVKDKLEELQKEFGIQKLKKQEIQYLLDRYRKQKSKRLYPGNIYIGLISGIYKNKYKVMVNGFEGYFFYKNSKNLKKGTPVYIRYEGGQRFKFVPYLEAALISIDNKTGGIRAIVGGYDIKKSEFNRAIQSKRQTGSSFKPIVYLDALLNGYTQISILKDEPISFWDTEKNKEWIPKNYEKEYYGDVTLRYALIHSLNVASVYLYNQLNPEEVIDLAYKLGIRTILKPVKSLVLGSIGVSPLEMAAVYSTFANYGKICEPYLVSKIIDSKGNVIYERKPQCTQVVPQDETAVLVDILKGVVKEGTGKKARILGFPVAGKTGTTDNYTDAWFAGFSPYYTTVVWVGYDYKKKIGWHATGARTALPIWINYMATAHANIEDMKDFPTTPNTDYYPINENTQSISNGTCEEEKLLFKIGTEPEYDCSGNFLIFLPEKFKTDILSQNIPALKKFKAKAIEKEGKIINNQPEDFIFDIKEVN